VWLLATGSVLINIYASGQADWITFETIRTKKSFSRISQASMVLSSGKTLPKRGEVSG